MQTALNDIEASLETDIEQLEQAEVMGSYFCFLKGSDGAALACIVYDVVPNDDSNSLFIKFINYNPLYRLTGDRFLISLMSNFFQELAARNFINVEGVAYSDDLAYMYGCFDFQPVNG